jgi:hypothetical protein
VRLSGAVDPDIADKCRDELWDATGYDRADRSTWTDTLVPNRGAGHAAVSRGSERSDAQASVRRGWPSGRIVVNHRPLRSVLLWSQLMGEHFAGTRYAQYFLSHNAAEALHATTETETR